MLLSLGSWYCAGDAVVSELDTVLVFMKLTVYYRVQINKQAVL
jgi:hypothetical protein